MKHHSVRTWSFSAIPASLFVFTALVSAALVSPTLAGPPKDNAAKLMASPLVQAPTAEPPGLPGVTCGGFSWFNAVPSLPIDPDAEVTLALSIIPFRPGPTSIIVGEGSARSVAVRVHFLDGLAEGIPYDRNNWNEVSITLSPLTQTFRVTVNGQTSATLPFNEECASIGGCHGFGDFIISGEFLHEDTAWADSIQIFRGPSTGPTPDLIYELNFDGYCTAPYAGLGAILLTAPPKSAKPRAGA